MGGCAGARRRVGRILSVSVFSVVELGELGQAPAVDLVLGGGGNDTVGDGAQGGGPVAALQHRALPDDRAWAELADLAAIHPDAEKPVEQQVDFAAGRALLGQGPAFG